MDTQISSRLVCLLLCAALTLVAGCTSYGPVLKDAAIRAWVLVEGDRVRIVTKSGEKHRFVVQGVEPTAIVGDNPEVSGARSSSIRVEYAEIETLEVGELSTATKVAGGTGAVAVGAFLLLLLTFPSFSGFGG